MSFLQILTRSYRRPRMLMANVRSLEAQTDGDFDQTMLVDGEGRGIGAAQAMLANHAPYVRGEMILILDDDDICIYPGLVARLKEVALEHDPDIVVVKMDHGPTLGILPDDDHWQKPPVLGHIGVSAAIVKRRIFQRHAMAFNSAHYASDFDYLSSLFSEDYEIYWLDIVATAVQRRSYGRPE